ncbi:MAG: glycosyltransferase family 2 protein [Lachnospiraceae bacterium]|nr:glycosyltransferase family 2 protein [Lachnospiraceae bacterium]MEE3461686.1 glycosyltransferase family 2 protein [Lachnospiraceae bacterium]
MFTFSMCMIVKNEEAVLARCLDSIKDIMDEIVIVDTGSTDSTKEIAGNYTDKIYDFAWTGSFADARNFAFGKCSGDYIYSADADEIIDEENLRLFKSLKAVLDPQIDMVQMYYDNDNDFNTVYNVKRELRPKLFKRLRTFTWIYPIHEVVRTEPLVFDSDIVILHRPVSDHAGRDFSYFEKLTYSGSDDEDDMMTGPAEQAGRSASDTGTLSNKKIDKRLLHMYSMELMKSGTEEDFKKAFSFYYSVTTDPERDIDELKEAFVIVGHYARLSGDMPLFMSMSLKDSGTGLTKEMCCELGKFYEEKNSTDEALIWFENALSDETLSILDARCASEIPEAEIGKLKY